MERFRIFTPIIKKEEQNITIILQDISSSETTDAFIFNNKINKPIESILVDIAIDNRYEFKIDNINNNYLFIKDLLELNKIIQYDVYYINKIEDIIETSVFEAINITTLEKFEIVANLDEIIYEIMIKFSVRLEHIIKNNLFCKESFYVITESIRKGLI